MEPRTPPEKPSEEPKVWHSSDYYVMVTLAQKKLSLSHDTPYNKEIKESVDMATKIEKAAVTLGTAINQNILGSTTAAIQANIDLLGKSSHKNAPKFKQEHTEGFAGLKSQANGFVSQRDTLAKSFKQYCTEKDLLFSKISAKIKEGGSLNELLSLLNELDKKGQALQTQIDDLKGKEKNLQVNLNELGKKVSTSMQITGIAAPTTAVSGAEATQKHEPD